MMAANLLRFPDHRCFHAQHVGDLQRDTATTRCRTRWLTGIAVAIVAALACAPVARAEWLQPDPSLRETQLLARMAARDTAGHAHEPGRLDSLGGHVLRLARLDDAATVYGRALALNPRDTEALAALGKIALFRDRLAEAESLLALAGPEPGALEDLLSSRIRLGRYATAAEVADDLGQAGRAEMLRALAETQPYQVTGGPEMARVQWVRAHPTPLVRVKLNGLSVLMAIDTGAGDLLLDPSAMRRAKVRKLSAQRTEFWSGARIAVSNAMVQRLEIGGIRIENLPAGVVPLRKWSLDVNPYGEQVAGVIGLNFLRRFTPTLDWKNHVLELRRAGAAPAVAAGTPRVPFEVWGESELTVYGSIGGGRRMAMVVQSGVPSCGIGAPKEVFDEAGVKPGMLSRVAKNAGQWLQGRAWTAVLVPAITVGPVAQDKVQGWSGALDSAELWRHGVRRDALLAGDFFRDWRVTIDWQAHELAIEN